jgi:heavy metal sensor kinase
MRFGRLDNFFRTLRFRLTFWNTGMIVVLLLAALAGVHVGLRWTLQHRMDGMLSEDVEEVALILERYWPNEDTIDEELERKAQTHRQRTWFARILNPDGEVRWATSNTPPLPPLPLRTPAPFDMDHYRLVQRIVQRPGLPPLVVRVGCSRERMDEDVNRVSIILLVAGAVILVVAPLGGWWLAGRATRPLATILATTARLRPDRLVERLPLRGTGDELDRLSETINGMLDRLAEHLRRQREFVANAAHELRSPLAAMRTTVDVALAHDRSAEEYRELLADLAEECGSLGSLVNHLLLLAEGDTGLLPADAVTRLDQLAVRSVDMFRGVAEVRGVGLELSVDGPVPVRGSDTHLREVIHNLLDNALKFTPAGGRVAVTVERSGPPGDTTLAQLRVRDTGGGIPAADLPHVFERFYRADKARPRDREAGSHGLGLSICRAIVTGYGGSIELDSTEGAGTVVDVLLPLAREDRAPGGRDACDTPRSEGIIATAQRAGFTSPVPFRPGRRAEQRHPK